jgi:hypothetical protein
MFKQAKIRKTLNYLIRAVIIVVTYGFIYRQVFHLKNPAEVLGSLEATLEQRDSWFLIGVVLFLMFLNWGLESLKWKLLIAKIETVSFLKSYKAVLTGVSVSLFTPNRTGDYLGRVFILDRANHIQGILITIIGSFAQLIITLCAGLVCLLPVFDRYLSPGEQYGFLNTGMIFMVPLTVLFLLFIYYKIGLLTDLINRYFSGRWEKLPGYASVFSLYSTIELSWNLGISFMRYIIFISQYLLLLRLFGAFIPAVEGFMLVSVIYLLMAMVPTVALADLGIRGSVSLFVLGAYFQHAQSAGSVPEVSILAASTAIWLVNLILPAILGTFFVFNLKFFRK